MVQPLQALSSAQSALGTSASTFINLAPVCDSAQRLAKAQDIHLMRLAELAQLLGLYDLARLDPVMVKRRWSVVLERTVRELQGTRCIGFEHEPPAKQEIACTRSFGQAVTEFASRVAQKLRLQNGHAGQVLPAV